MKRLLTLALAAALVCATPSVRPVEAQTTASLRLLSGAREPVRVATTTNITLSGLQTIDSVALAAGDRILVKDQADATQNGIYDASAGFWRRSGDATNPRTLTAGILIPVQEGVFAGSSYWRVTTIEPDIGDDEIVIERYLSASLLEDTQALVDQAEAAAAEAEGASQIPAGGTTGQLLAKKTSSDFDAEWVDPSEADDAMPKSTYDPDDNGVIGLAQGGTNATSASAARTSLGLAIGSNVQAWDSDLDALAGVSSAGIRARTGSGEAARTITGTTNQITVSNGTGAAGDPTIAAVIASQSESEAGTNAVKLMTPQRTAQAIAALSVGGGGTVRAVQGFTSSGTYSRTTGTTKAIVICTGGGGAGGGSNDTGFGSGGASGRTRIGVIVPGATETVTIGAGGTGSSAANGGSGSTTTFGSHVSCPGGGGGKVDSDTLASAAAAGTGGIDLGAFLGKPGQSTPGNFASFRDGAGSFWGPGGDGPGSTQGDGNPGQAYGSGGSGSGTESGANATGGSGAAGFVLVIEY